MNAKEIIKMVGKQTVIQNPNMPTDLKKFSFDFSYNSSMDPDHRDYITQSQVYNDLGKVCTPTRHPADWLGMRVPSFGRRL
jgi:hypothetical protein